MKFKTERGRKRLGIALVFEPSIIREFIVRATVSVRYRNREISIVDSLFSLLFPSVIDLPRGSRSFFLRHYKFLL
jgi:hypothetical protein